MPDSSFGLFYVYLISDNIINEYRNSLNIYFRGKRNTDNFKHIQRYSVLLKIKDMQIKTRVTSNFILVRMMEIKRETLSG